MNWIVLLGLLARLGLSDAGAAMVLTGGLPASYGGGLRFENGKYVAVLNNMPQLSELLVVKDGEMRFTIEMVGEQSPTWWLMRFGMIGGQSKRMCIIYMGVNAISFYDDVDTVEITIRESTNLLNYIMSPDGTIKSINGEVDSQGELMVIGMPNKPTFPGMYGFTMSFSDPNMVIKVYFDPGYVATVNYV